jgi:hypothetical protein
MPTLSQPKRCKVFEISSRALLVLALAYGKPLGISISPLCCPVPAGRGENLMAGRAVIR